MEIATGFVLFRTLLIQREQTCSSKCSHTVDVQLVPLQIRLAQLLLAAEYLDGSELSCFFFCEKSGRFTRSEYVEGDLSEHSKASTAQQNEVLNRYCVTFLPITAFFSGFATGFNAADQRRAARAWTAQAWTVIGGWYSLTTVLLEFELFFK